MSTPGNDCQAVEEADVHIQNDAIERWGCTPPPLLRRVVAGRDTMQQASTSLASSHCNCATAAHRLAVWVGKWVRHCVAVRKAFGMFAAAAPVGPTGGAQGVGFNTRVFPCSPPW